MHTLALSAYLNSEIGVHTDLLPAGTALENPYVYDASAKELKAMASLGLIRIVNEQRGVAARSDMIKRLAFERLR